MAQSPEHASAVGGRPNGEERTGEVAVGVDLGLSVTDAVMLRPGEACTEPAHVRFDTSGREPAQVLQAALDALGSAAAGTRAIGVTGGRSASLAPGRGPSSDAVAVVVGEPEAIGRGGLHLAGLRRALVVSCGTGTAMIAADADVDATHCYVHASGTPVGGGTLQALGGLLLGSRDAHAIAALAAAGDAGLVDTTLGEVLGGGLGTLPARATAVSLGRLAEHAREVRREDLAAGLVTMVAQTIALIALNAARAYELPAVVMVGRIAELAPVRAMMREVFRVYGVSGMLSLPPGAAYATALGAALTVSEATDVALDGPRMRP